MLEYSELRSIASVNIFDIVITRKEIMIFKSKGDPGSGGGSEISTLQQPGHAGTHPNNIIQISFLAVVESGELCMWMCQSDTFFVITKS